MSAPNLGPDLVQNPEACPEQRKRTLNVERALKKHANRLASDQVASIFHLQVYAFNCSDSRHKNDGPHPFHIDYVAGGGRWDVPGALQASITALEHALAELKKRVQ